MMAEEIECLVFTTLPFTQSVFCNGQEKSQFNKQLLWARLSCIYYNCTSEMNMQMSVIIGRQKKEGKWSI